MNLMNTSLIILAIATTAVKAAPGEYYGAGKNTVIVATEPKSNMYIGLGAGWTHVRILNEFSLPDYPSKKYKANKSGFIGGFHLGHINNIDETYFLTKELAIAWDSAKIKKNVGRDFTATLTRNYSASAKIGFGMKIDPEWSASIQAGLAQTHMSYSLRVNDPGVLGLKISKSKNLWGGVVGAGICKSYGSYSIGLDYEYTRYQNFKAPLLAGSQTSLKKPEYHTVMLKFSKAF